MEARYIAAHESELRVPTMAERLEGTADARSGIRAPILRSLDEFGGRAPMHQVLGQSGTR